MKKRVFAVLTVLCLVATMFVAFVIPVSAATFNYTGVFDGFCGSLLTANYNGSFSCNYGGTYAEQGITLGRVYSPTDYNFSVTAVVSSSAPLTNVYMYFSAAGYGSSRKNLTNYEGTNIYYVTFAGSEWMNMAAGLSPDFGSFYFQNVDVSSGTFDVSLGVISTVDFEAYVDYKTGMKDVEYTPSISMYQLPGYQQLPSDNVNFHPELVQTYSASVPVGGSYSVSLDNPLYYYGMQYVEILVVFPYAPVPIEEMPRFAYVNGFYGSGASRVLWNDTGGFWYTFFNEQNEAFSAFRILCPYEVFNNSFAGIEIENISQTVLNVNIQVFPYEAADPFLMAQNVTYNSAYETGQNAGYNRGFNDGVDYASSTSYDEGYDKGRLDGYASGYAFGHSAGYAEGQNDEYSFSTFIGALIDAPIQYLSSMFNFTIFGFDMKTAFFSIISLCVLVTIVRVFI